MSNKPSVQTKIFIGARVTPELRPLLDNVTQLHLISFEQKHYIGLYADSSHPTLDEVRALCNHLTSQLGEIMKEISSRTPQIVVFPQLFLG